MFFHVSRMERGKAIPEYVLPLAGKASIFHCLAGHKTLNCGNLSSDSSAPETPHIKTTENGIPAIGNDK